MKLLEPKAWRDELSDTAFIAANTEEEALAAEWERVRHAFINDSRTMGDLEAVTRKIWVSALRRDPVYVYAERSWDKLRWAKGMGLKRIRSLVEILSTAALR